MDTIDVKFYNWPTVDDKRIMFVVIASKFNGKWVYVKHRERDTWEIPGGRREAGEEANAAARRELYEETGALEFSMRPVCAYSVTGRTRVNEDGSESFGMLYYARISRLGRIDSEIERIEFFDSQPDNLTYPAIQPRFIELIESLCI